jgi:hypothetical protein
MLGSEILEVGIGLTLIYLLLSAMASALREALEAWFKTRGEHLERGIRELLRDPDGSWMARGIYEHPLVAGLFRGGYTPRQGGKNLGNFLHWLGGRSNLPSYIPAPNFAAALLDIVARGPVVPDAVDNAPPPAMSVELLRTNAQAMANPYLQRAILVAIDRGQGDLNRVQANLEAWYNSGMDRVSGWYKRRTQFVLLWIGLGLTLALNVNTITIAGFLMRDSTARALLVRQADAIRRDPTMMTASYARVDSTLTGLKLPIGWGGDSVPARPGIGPDGSAEESWGGFWHHVFGLLITAFAVSLGAPFWFDVLNKFMVIRSTVKPHEKSPEEDSEDGKGKAAKQSSQRIGGALPDDDGKGKGAGVGTATPGGGTGGTPQTAVPVGAGAAVGAGAGTTPGAATGATAGAGAGETDAEFEPHRWTNGDPEEGDL